MLFAVAVLYSCSRTHLRDHHWLVIQPHRHLTIAVAGGLPSFAYLALHRFMRSPELRDVVVELRPVDPTDFPFLDNPSDNPTKLAYVMHDAARQAAEAGLPATPFQQLENAMQGWAAKAVAKQPPGQQRLADARGWGKEDWRTNAKALLYALDHKCGWEFADAMCQVRWGLHPELSRQSIEDPDVIAKVADSVGLDGRRCVHAVQTTASYEARLVAIAAQSRRDLVFGVPFFTYRGQRFWGNDRLPALLQHVRGLEPSEGLPALTVGPSVVAARL